jgi:DNA-binding response OmpR family regulator
MRDILIVEDGRTERERLERLFTDAGYSVLAHENVGDAERTIEREGFRLAIIDIGLSDKSGSYLFNVLKRGHKVSYIIILTGNPSVHLKQRFLTEGAIDYLVKGSAQAQNDALLGRVKEIIGDAQPQAEEGLELEDFLKRYVAPTSRRLFLDMHDSPPPCKNCGTKRYMISFSKQTQMPPEIVGLVVCAGCGSPMDPEIG